MENIVGLSSMLCLGVQILDMIVDAGSRIFILDIQGPAYACCTWPVHVEERLVGLTFEAIGGLETCDMRQMD